MYRLKWPLLLLSHFLLCLPLFNVWFTGDTFVALSTIFSYSPIEILFCRDAYALFNRYFFTPLMPISFLDGYLFGLNPIGYHLHNYLALFLTALIIYKVARIYLPSSYAFLSSVFFLFSTPVFFDIACLVRKHYNWGCFFFFLSFYLFKYFEKESEKRFLVLSLVAYFISLLFKSAFSPLPVVIFLLCNLKFTKRFGIFLLYISVLLLYLVWRFYMLGGIGGYMFLPTISFHHVISTVFLNIPYEVSKMIWLIPFFVYVVPIALFVMRPKVGVVFVALIFISISPFIFTTVWEGYTFTGKFLTLCGIISIALSFFIYYIKNTFPRFPYYLICMLILGLQMVQLPKAFKEEKSHANMVKSTCHRLLEGDIKVVYDRSSWTYNYFFLVKHLQGKKMPKLIGIGALDRSNLPLDLYLYHRYIEPLSERDHIFIPCKNKDLRYMEVKEKIEMMQKKEVLPRPDIKLDYKEHLLKVKIIDKRKGHFRMCFLATPNKGNTAFWSIPIRKKAFSLPMMKGDNMFFLFVSSDGRFSSPLIFNQKEIN